MIFLKYRQKIVPQNRLERCTARETDMDSHEITNAWAKTHMAVRHLAAAEQTVQQRVIDAFNKHLARIPNEGLTQDIVSRLDEVRANLILARVSRRRSNSQSARTTGPRERSANRKRYRSALLEYLPVTFDLSRSANFGR